MEDNLDAAKSEITERVRAPLSSADIHKLHSKLARARRDLELLEAQYNRAVADQYWWDYHNTDRYRGKR